MYNTNTLLNPAIATTTAAFLQNLSKGLSLMFTQKIFFFNALKQDKLLACVMAVCSLPGINNCCDRSPAKVCLR